MADQIPHEASREVMTPPSHPNAIVVDDDPAVRSTVVALLEETGLAVVEASDAFEAFEVICERPHLETAVIDLQMPGLGGAQLAAVIGDMRPNVAVVIISGQSSPLEKEVPDRMVFLPKPFTGHELAAAINRARAQTQAEQSTPPDKA
ncbi:MAG TPA: response regulator [Allosphingosinicella sp.]|nr:response regulator [Allosphingosinicella sp.]